MLSIIIPALNEEKYLPNLLADLSRQIYRNFEVIVVDGGSKDKTVALAKKFSRKLSQFKIIASPKPHVCVQRNLGAKAAKNEILVFIDADSRIGPEFLLGLRYRWEQAKADVLSFWLKPDEPNRQNETIAVAVNLFMELNHNLKPKYLMESLFAVDKASFLKVGGFNETIQFGEGTPLMRALVKAGCTSKICRDPSYNYSFRRLRQEGLVKMASALAGLELSKLLGEDYRGELARKYYPMTGGRQFINRKKTKLFLTKIKKLMESISNSF